MGIAPATMDPAPTLKRTARPSRRDDRRRLAALIHLEPFVHQHPGWHAPLDRLGTPGFVVWENSHGVLEGALSIRPEADTVGWVRLFAASAATSPAQVWEALWPHAIAPLQTRGTRWIAAMPFTDWFRRLLEEKDFRLTEEVAMLVWKRQPLPAFTPPQRLHLRPMVASDLAAVAALDAKAFAPFWQMSPESFTVALARSVWATVIEDPTSSQILGFQISTPSPLGGHLARIAVHPQAQGQGIGRWLVHNALTFFQRNQAEQVTLNTQGTNTKALAIYQRMGFQDHGERYPVYRYDLQAHKASNGNAT